MQHSDQAASSASDITVHAAGFSGSEGHQRQWQLQPNLAMEPLKPANGSLKTSRRESFADLMNEPHKTRKLAADLQTSHHTASQKTSAARPRKPSSAASLAQKKYMERKKVQSKATWWVQGSYYGHQMQSKGCKLALGHGVPYVRSDHQRCYLSTRCASWGLLHCILQHWPVSLGNAVCSVALIVICV